MRKVLVSIFGLAIPLVIVLWVNTHINEAYFSVPNQLADLVVSGHQVFLSSKYIDYDERAFKKSVIEHKRIPDDVIAIGSSRSRYVRSDLFSGQSFHNYAVNAASLEDYILIYGLLKTKGLLPKRIIICLDYWILKKDSGYTNWQRLADDYYAAAKQIGIETKQVATESKDKGAWADLIELFSPAYFQHNVSLLLEHGWGKAEDRDFTRDQGKGVTPYIINADGSFGDERSPNPIEDVRRIVRTIDPQSPQLKEVDPELARNFELFLVELTSKNIVPTLVLLPIHPYTYGEWIKDDKMGLKLAEDYFRQVAKKHGVEIIGSIDPTVVGVDEFSFRDWLHPRVDVVKRVLKPAEG